MKAFRFNQLADDALSIDVETVETAHAAANALRLGEFWEEVVPGLDSVVVVFDPMRHSLDDAKAQAQSLLSKLDETPKRHSKVWRIPVAYGGSTGPDLDAVCQQCGVTAQTFIAAHTRTPFPVDLIGFTPGFAYIGGLDPKFDVPRLERPRARVPAGSIGFATGYTGLYALEGPGGWPLIGRTDYYLFDAGGEEMFLIHAGDLVHFCAV